MKLYVDQDGVLADFNGAMAAAGIQNDWTFIHKPASEWTPAQADLDRRVREEMDKRHFWSSIPILPDAYALWDYCKLFRHYVLTARPNKTTDIERVEYQKRHWVRDHFGPFPDERIIVCLRSDKKRYATTADNYGYEPNVLVDDMPANCEEWNKAGGIAILHTSAEDTIQKLRRLFYD